MNQGNRGTNPTEEAGLVSRAKSGEQAAFEEIFHRHRGQVYSLAYRMTGNNADAEDICQDVFIQCMRKIGTFKGQSSFSTWLYRVTINRSKDHLRRGKRSPEVLQSDDAPDSLDRLKQADNGTEEPEKLAITQETSRLVQEALLELPVNLRIPLVLYEIEGFKYEELSRMLHLPTGTVKSRIFRARLRLAEILEPHKEHWR